LIHQPVEVLKVIHYHLVPDMLDGCFQFQLLLGLCFVIQFMKWPRQSPDMNPIEQVWHMMKLKIVKHKPNNKAELKATINHVWDNELILDDLQYLYRLMHCRAQARYNVNGGPTKC
jgi:hypothetical protein